MPTAALHTKQILFQRAMGGSPDVFETLGEVKGFDGPSMSAAAMDATSFDSTWKEKLVGVPDGGQVTFQFNWIPANGPQSRFKDDFDAGTLRAYRIQLTDNTVISFSAYITAISISGAVDQVTAGSATLEITGQVN